MIKIAFEEYMIGKRERSTWIVETSFGTGGTMTSGEVVGMNCVIVPSFSKGWQEVLTAGVDNLTVQSRVKGPENYSYTMSFVPYNWRWLKYLMTVANGDDGGIKTHTFTVNTSITSYKLEWAKRHTTAHVLTLTGNVAKSGTISWRKATGEGTEGFISVSMDNLCKAVAQGSTVSTVSAITDDPFQYRMVKITIAGSEVVEVNNGELKIDLGIDANDSRYCNSTLDVAIGEPIPKVFRITGRVNVNIKDKTFFDLWNAGTVVAGTNTLLFDRDGTGDDQMLFTFANFIIHGAVAPTNLEGVTNVDLIFSAYTFTAVARDAITTY